MKGAITLGLFSLPLMAGIAQADITFENVSITGSLVSGASYATGSNSIDFSFPDATVGDPTDPYRVAGTIIITYEATSTDGMVANQMLLSVLGALAGSGQIYFNEVIEDVDTATALATYNAVVDSNDELPLVATLDFAHAATHIKVKKTLFLTAVDTDAFDFANVALIEQTIREIPTPGAASMALVAVGGLLSLRRRRQA